MQILEGVLLAFTALLRMGVSAQLVADTGLEGTWSTGSGAVETGQKYFNIVNDTFTVPPLTGQAYSFQPRTSSTGYYEELIYKFNTSGTLRAVVLTHSSGPGMLHCGAAVAAWQLHHPPKQLDYHDALWAGWPPAGVEAVR